MRKYCASKSTDKCAASPKGGAKATRYDHRRQDTRIVVRRHNLIYIREMQVDWLKEDVMAKKRDEDANLSVIGKIFEYPDILVMADP